MKLEITFKEAIYLIPVISSQGMGFLFFNLQLRDKASKYIAWITPMIAISYKGKLELWILWIRWGIVITFERCVYDGKTTLKGYGNL